MTLARLLKVWCLFLAATLIAVTIAIRWLDIPVALFFLGSTNHVAGLGAWFSSTVLIAGEMTLLAGLAVTRIARGSLPEFAKALFVASCASLSAFVVNDHVLKVVFGRQNPSALLQGIPNHVFNFFQGDQQSSFPSGHMVMATAFAIAMIRLQPRTLSILIILLCIGATSLMIGDWHFVGDIIAGTFVGGTAGLVTAELWLDHVRRHGLT